jgi:uncharacterized protein
MKVTRLTLAPVKGMRVTHPDELELLPTGARGDRAFLVVDRDDGLLLTTRHPRLLQIAPRWDGETLTLAFPDGSEVSARPEPTALATTANYAGRPIHGRTVEGALAEAVSEHLGRPVKLLMRDEGERGADDAPVTLMSNGSLFALAPALDARRFRMTIAIDGAQPWEEHGWGGREIAVGEARLRGIEPVPRCVVTTRDPDSGATDAPVLKELARIRGKDDVRFGIWCDVLAPGRVRVGDAVEVT